MWPWASKEELREREAELFFGTDEPPPPGLAAYLTTPPRQCEPLTRARWEEMIERVRSGGL